MESGDERVRVVALICITVVVVAVVVCLTVVAVATDRDMVGAARPLLLIVLLVAVLGGLSWVGIRRRHRWRIEREDTDDGS